MVILVTGVMSGNKRKALGIEVKKVDEIKGIHKEPLPVGEGAFVAAYKDGKLKVSKGYPFPPQKLSELEGGKKPFSISAEI